MVRRIALVLQHASGYGARAALGVRRYAHGRDDWELRVWEPSRQRLRELARWRPHGVVGYVGDGRLARRLAALRVPVVNVSQAAERSPFPLVTVDNLAVGAAAARHLLALGGRRFAVVRGEPTAYARLRERGFVERLRAARCAAAVFRDRGLEGVGRWLRELPKPAAVFACTDFVAYHLARRCQEAGLHVPAELALLGADNEEEASLLAKPPLSSVGIPAERTGFEAAALLDRLLDGARAPREALLVPPLPVVERESTREDGGSDPRVAAALAFIRARAREGVGVDQVAAAVHAGRRTLERRFRALLGRSVGACLRRARALPVKRLLAESDLTLEEIARRTGFHSAQHLSEFFRDLEGSSPGGFRRTFRAQAGGAPSSDQGRRASR